ncbi:MAG: antibiotic biosynthesis monooxygenase family protein [Methanomassiliicoccales archaeon]
MAGRIVEIAQFRLKEGMDEERFLSISNGFQEKYLEKQEGYIDRELLRSGGVWVDLIHWESLEAAQAVADEIMEHPESKDYIDTMDPESVSLRFFQQVQVF